MSKKCGLSISLHVCVQGRIREWLILTYTPFSYITMYFKFYMFFSLYITDYLIELTFLVIPISFSMWLGVRPKGTNKTQALMGFGPFCQLLTSTKLALIIFNTTI